MSNPNHLYQTAFMKTSEKNFINHDSLPYRQTSPHRFIQSNTNTPFQMKSSQNIRSTMQPETNYLMTKSIGHFGQQDYKSPESIQINDVSGNLNNHVTELNSQIRRLTEKTDQLYNENRSLKKDADSLTICRGRLEERENELKRMNSNTNFLESNISNLKAELENSYAQSRQLSNQLAEIFNKNPGKYHMDQISKRILSADEYEMERRIKTLQEKVLSVEKERDRLFLENYEYKKLHGDTNEIGQDPEEFLGMRYQNGLQIASLDLNKSRKKIEALQSENDLLRNELNILRGIDCFEENDVKSGLMRINDQTKQ